MTDAFAQTRDQAGPMDGLKMDVPPVFQARPQERQVAEAASGRDGMPPQDVLDAAMILSQSCGEWKLPAQPAPDKDGPPTRPLSFNATTLHHMELCSVANDPSGVSKGSEAFAAGAMVAIGAILGLYVLLRIGKWVLGKVRAFIRNRSGGAALVGGPAE